ncbi:MAG TPA: acetyl-CoA carboxylase biotin carboxyl carrier protein [Candidatus Limiplasma sp.]|nr:acetyl-CoA carboxylase biotin carboxyl carrier protein [Candidatus Limiplasma sp.]
MNIDDVKALAEVLAQSDLSVLEYKEGDVSIRLERASGCAPAAKCEPAVPAANAAEDMAEQHNDFNNMHELKAPMVGVFYAAASPEAEPFVKVGDFVEKGQVVCILEAMKLMNDITAPVSGRIVDICAQNGVVMEYGQTIMKII